MIWVKYPGQGKVKLKLARSVGEEKARALYREWTEKCLESTRPENEEYERVIFYDPSGRPEEYEKWLGTQIPMRPQTGRDLAERLKTAFEEMFLRYSRILVMGSEKPSLTRDYLAIAFEALEKSEVVLGPTSEGGFYLLGLRKMIPEIFEKTLWSTPFVFDTVFKVLTSKEIDPHLLPVMTDDA